MPVLKYYSCEFKDENTGILKSEVTRCFSNFGLGSDSQLGVAYDFDPCYLNLYPSLGEVKM